MSIFTPALDFLHSLFHSAGKVVSELSLALAKVMAESGGEFLAQTALTAVAAAETSGGTGTEKFNAAKAVVVTALEGQGIPVVLNAIHAALEGAVAHMKAA